MKPLYVFLFSIFFHHTDHVENLGHSAVWRQQGAISFWSCLLQELWGSVTTDPWLHLYLQLPTQYALVDVRCPSSYTGNVIQIYRQYPVCWSIWCSVVCMYGCKEVRLLKRISRPLFHYNSSKPPIFTNSGESVQFTFEICSHFEICSNSEICSNFEIYSNVWDMLKCLRYAQILKYAQILRYTHSFIKVQEVLKSYFNKNLSMLLGVKV